MGARLVFTVVVTLGTTAPAAARGPQVYVPLDAVPAAMRDSVVSVIRAPDVEFRRERIDYQCGVGLMEGLLDDLVLSAALWHSYRYRPRYIVESLGPDWFTITDRKWVEGELKLLYNQDGTRLYYARGIARIHSVPGMAIGLYGTTVVVMSYAGDDSTLVGDVYLYSRVDDGLMGHMARAVLPVLKHFMESRVDEVIDKVRVIAEDVARTPGEVAGKMEDRAITFEQITAFRRRFGRETRP